MPDTAQHSGTPDREPRAGDGATTSSSASTSASANGSGGPAGGSGPIDGLVQFVKDAWAELHRVQWPTQQTIIKHTTIVVCLVIFMAVYTGTLDYSLTWFFHNIFRVSAERAGGGM